MSETVRLSNFASIANAVFNSVSANATAVTAMTVGGHTINATGFPGTANNASNLGGVAAASYALLAGPTFTGNTTVANLAFTGLRITGDFSNATPANRLAFQSSTTNGATGLYVLPNGSATVTAVQLFANSNPSNTSMGVFATSSTEVQISSTRTGTGDLLPLTFFVGTSERMRILANNGNVGIGITSPVARLQLTGTAATTSPTGGSASGSAFYVNNTDTAYGMQFGIAGNGSGWIQQQRSDGTNEQYSLILQPIGGNVGIGTSTPGARLDVVTSSPTQARFKAPSGGTAQIVSYPGGCEFSSSDSSVIYGTGAVGGLTAFWAGNAERMRIDASGRVLKPFQPAFHASGETSISVSISNYTLALPTAVTNRGSHYNTSTFRFTAPVTGMYMFAHRVTWSSTGTGVAVHLSVNGSPFGGAAAYSEVFGYTTGTAYHTTSAAVSFVQLNANDFVDLRTVIYNSSAQSIDLTRSSFSGCLIG